MAGLSIAKGVDRAGLARISEGLVVALAASLPWSTSATAILVVFGAVTFIPTANWADIRRELLTPAGGLPVLLVGLGLAGVLWSGVAPYERWNGFDSFPRLLAIPLLFVQFSRSGRGERVFIAYLLSCVAF